MEEHQNVAPNQLLEPDEHVLAIVKKHWAGLAGIILTTFAALIALIVLAVILGSQSSDQIDQSTYTLIMAVGVLVIGILLLILLLISYIYRQSKLTITDRSLLQVVQNGLFNRKVSRLSMSNVEDVNVQENGFLPTILNFGTLTVETAGEEDNFIFPMCPYPNRYAQIILEARQQYADTHLAK